MTAGAAGGAGDHSTVTDVADAAPHLRLFQRSGRVAVHFGGDSRL